MSYTTVLIDERHRPLVVNLWRSNLRGIAESPRLDARASWLYDDSPDGRVDTVLAMVKEDEEPAACGSILRRQMKVAETDVCAGIAIDFAVSRSHRSGAAALMVQRRIASFVDGGELPFVLTFPNNAARALFMRIGYKQIAKAPGWVKPLRVAYKLKPLVRSRLLARLLAFPADVALALRDRFKSRRTLDTRIEEPEKADDRFDALWSRAHAHYNMTTARTARYLNWRYTQFTTMRYRYFCLVRNSGELVGYVVHSSSEGKVFVVDLFAETMPLAFSDVLPAFCEHMRKEGSDVVFFRYIGPAGIDDDLRQLGFFMRPETARSLLVYSGNGGGREELLDAASWFVTDGEVDI